MVNAIFQKNTFKKGILFLFLAFGLWGNAAQAGLMPTGTLIGAHGDSYTQSQLQLALASSELKAQLESKGVDIAQLSDRIASLTPSEIMQLNTELEQQPAGGIVGTLATIFIVLVVTDLLCATDIFSFVRCIAR